MKKIPDPLYALGAAFLFGIGLPVSKMLLTVINPIMLSSLVFLGSATGLSLIIKLEEIYGKKPKTKAFEKEELSLLITVSIFGSLLPSILLMSAVKVVSASSASLALNLEIVFTSLIAWIFFKERVTLVSFLGLLSILLGGICLAWSKEAQMSWPLLMVCGACLSWSIDNNLLGKITKTQPIKIARFRGLFACSVNMCLSLFLGYHFPNVNFILGATLAGLICYGFSFTVFVKAIHKLGAIKAIAYFSTAPLLAAILSVLILKEAITPNLIFATIFMAVGVWMHMSEKHAYEKPIYPT